MPADFWLGVWSMLAAAGIVLASILPVAAIAGWLVRRDGRSLLPPWRPSATPWGGIEVILTVVVVFVLIPTTVAAFLFASGIPTGTVSAPPSAAAAVAGVPAATGLGLQQASLERIVFNMWAAVLAFPVQVCLMAAVSRVIYPSWWLMPRPSLSARVVLAILAWLPLTLLVLIVNGLINIIFTLLHWGIQPHTLTRLAGQSGEVAVLFVVQVSIAAPVIEEILFRGVILGWAIGRRKPVPVPDVPGRLRPWLLMLLTLLLAAKAAAPGGADPDGGEAGSAARLGAPIFALLLAAGLALVMVGCRRRRKTAAAVFSSAALFGMVHADFWPTPVPLFLLGLGLGWLAVRTRSLLVPILVHGLFNAISAVYVLRSPG